MRYFRVVFLILIATTSLYIGMLELSGVRDANPAAVSAQRAAVDIATATAGVYVSLRIINAALSTAQEVEIGASVGAQVGVQPLKVLEPIDDTVERVASVVFAVAAGAALVNVGVAPVAGLGLVMFGLGILGLMLCGLAQPLASFRPMALRVMRLGAALGVLLPVGFAVGVELGDRLTRAQADAAYEVINRIQAEAATLIGVDTSKGAITAEDIQNANGGQGFFARIGDGFSALADGVGDAVDTTERYLQAIGYFLTAADELFSASLTIMGVFALRMLVLPALLMWAGMTFLRRSVGA